MLDGRSCSTFIILCEIGPADKYALYEGRVRAVSSVLLYVWTLGVKLFQRIDGRMNTVQGS